MDGRRLHSGKEVEPGHGYGDRFADSGVIRFAANLAVQDEAGLQFVVIGAQGVGTGLLDVRGWFGGGFKRPAKLLGVERLGREPVEVLRRPVLQPDGNAGASSQEERILVDRRTLHLDDANLLVIESRIARHVPSLPPQVNPTNGRRGMSVSSSPNCARSRARSCSLRPAPLNCRARSRSSGIGTLALSQERASGLPRVRIADTIAHRSEGTSQRSWPGSYVFSNWRTAIGNELARSAGAAAAQRADAAFRAISRRRSGDSARALASPPRRPPASPPRRPSATAWGFFFMESWYHILIALQA